MLIRLIRSTEESLGPATCLMDVKRCLFDVDMGLIRLYPDSLNTEILADADGELLVGGLEWETVEFNVAREVDELQLAVLEGLFIPWEPAKHKVRDRQLGHAAWLEAHAACVCSAAMINCQREYGDRFAVQAFRKLEPTLVSWLSALGQPWTGYVEHEAKLARIAGEKGNENGEKSDS